MTKRLSVLAAPMLLAALAPAFAQNTDWAVYGGEGGRRFSSLAQITGANVGKLQQAWRFDMTEAGDPQTHPLAIDGVVYAYTPSLETIALDGASGRLLWRFSSGVKAGGPQRGLAMWRKGREQRLFANAGSYLYALDPKTGKPLAGFGEGGRIDLRQGLDRDPDKISVALTTPGVIWRDMIIMGFRTAESAPAAPGTSVPLTCIPESSAGCSTPFRIRTSRVTRPGRRIIGRPAEARMPGPAWCWMKSAAFCLRPPALRSAISTAMTAPATISMPIPCWRWMQPAASCCGISRVSITTLPTGISRRRRCC